MILVKNWVFFQHVNKMKSFFVNKIFDPSFYCSTSKINKRISETLIFINLDGIETEMPSEVEDISKILLG